MRNRISALILSAPLTATCLFASCGEAADDDLQTDLSDSGTTAQTEEVPELDKLENVDYEGYTFKIIFNDTENFAWISKPQARETGDIMNDTVYARNLAVEEKFNIKIESTGDVNDTFCRRSRNRSMAGDEPYDFYFSDCHAAALAPEGYFYELNSLPGLDLSNPWWDKAGIEGMSVGNKLYLMTGDISPSSLLTSSCMVFNKNLHDDAGIEYPYDMVRNGEWTIIKLAEITADLTLDLNGDGEYKLGDDVFGYSSWMCDSPFSLFYGAGRNADHEGLGRHTGRRLRYGQNLEHLQIYVSNNHHEQLVFRDRPFALRDLRAVLQRRRSLLLRHHSRENRPLPARYG